MATTLATALFAGPKGGLLDTTQSGKRGGKILLVDDEPEVRRAIARVLTRSGHEVVEAGGGREATEQLSQSRFDAVLTDISMPGMDGIALMRVVRERDADVPIVLLTGAPELTSALSAIELGAYRYLPKPVANEALRDVIGKAVMLGRVARLKREAIELSGEGLGASDLVGLQASFERAMNTMWIAYQPIVRAADRSLYGYEALLRSQEPSLPHPGAVLDAAERLGRLVDLGRQVRDRAAAPIEERADDSRLFVNLHPRDLADDALLSDMAPLSQIASRVVLEITERTALGQVRDLAARLNALRAMGFKLAVDDLGAGYAGLTSFAQLEPEIVKLDMSIVRDAHRSETKQKVIRSMASLCHEMGMLIVAEGVENAQERDVLVSLGCDLLQGYYLARPGKAFPDYAWGES